MSLSMTMKLNYGDSKLTQMKLRLTSHYITYPYGVLKYVLIRVNDLLFLVGFVILDMY